MDKQLTVLMSVYNGLPYLHEAIESILQQSFEDFEFLIIDDASTDDTPDVLNRYAKEDSRIRVIRSDKNQGLGATLKQGVQLAQTEWIARMDSDDIALPERLATQVDFSAANPDIDLFGTWIYDVNDEGEILGERRFPTDHDTIRRLIWTNPFKHSTVMFRRSELLRIGSYDAGLAKRQDYELWFRCIAGGLRTANIPVALLKYRYTADHFQRNNWRIAWDQSILGWRGCRLVKASPLAYIGVAKPLVVASLPHCLRSSAYRLFYRFDPRHKKTDEAAIPVRK